MTVRFVKGGTDFTVKNPLFPYEPTHDRMQFKGKTAGGTQVVQKLAVPLEGYIFQFHNMSPAERLNLFNFYKDDVDGAMATFTFTDVAAVEHTARWMDDTFDFQMVAQDRWSGQITLQYE